MKEKVSSPSQNSSSNILSQLAPPPSPAGRFRFKGGLEALAGCWLAKPGCLGIVGGCCFLAKAWSLGCRLWVVQRVDLGVGVSGLASLQLYEKVPNTSLSLSDFPVVTEVGSREHPQGWAQKKLHCDVGDAG